MVGDCFATHCGWMGNTASTKYLACRRTCDWDVICMLGSATYMAEEHAQITTMTCAYIFMIISYNSFRPRVILVCHMNQCRESGKWRSCLFVHCRIEMKAERVRSP